MSSKNGEVFVTVEAVITEINDVGIKREEDRDTGCRILNINDKNT